MSFCTVINCMDGRTQIPVIRYLQDKFGVDYVDSITEPGPNLILAEGKRTDLINSILARLEISMGAHNSVGIAVVGHHGCAGNPAPQDVQIAHIKKAIQFLRQHYKAEIIGLWVDSKWEVEEIA